ncbi:MAG: LptF/LptG family permease [Xanthobacteraceae bacterium]|nr:LptF/LptG family permease [Xanthobacteraceae bacterium]
MGRLGRYILFTTGGAFVAVLVVLTSMIWLTQALRRFDLLTSQGQSLKIFAIVTGLSLPTLVLVTAPIALFIAVAYTLNKLNTDSELVVMSASGVSPWQIFLPPLLLSIAVATISFMIATDLSPRSLRVLRDQLMVVNADIVTNVAIPGRFTSIERGLTFHVRERGPGGVLLGIFINDARNAAESTTYLADRGRLVNSEGGLFLVLEQGSMQRGGGAGKTASMVEFERYAFDMSQFGAASATAINKPGFRNLSELIWPPADDPVYKADSGRFRVELHKRLSTPLYPLAAFVVAFAFLGSPRTTRQSRGLAFGGAVSSFILIEIAGLGSGGLVQRNEVFSVLPYAVPLLGILFGLLSIAGLIEARMPVLLQRIADAVAARVERLQPA